MEWESLSWGSAVFVFKHSTDDSDAVRREHAEDMNVSLSIWQLMLRTWTLAYLYDS